MKLIAEYEFLWQLAHILEFVSNSLDLGDVVVVVAPQTYSVMLFSN